MLKYRSTAFKSVKGPSMKVAPSYEDYQNKDYFKHEDVLGDGGVPLSSSKRHFSKLKKLPVYHLWHAYLFDSQVQGFFVSLL